MGLPSERCVEETGLDRHLRGVQVTGGLVAHQGGDLGDDLPELLDTGILIPEYGQLVLDQRVVKNVYHFIHVVLPLYYFQLWQAVHARLGPDDGRRAPKPRPGPAPPAGPAPVPRALRPMRSGGAGAAEQAPPRALVSSVHYNTCLLYTSRCV